MNQLSFYIMEDRAVEGCVKVGKDTSWPKRFVQARCHTPGEIHVCAVFILPPSDRSEQDRVDHLVRSALAPFRRNIEISGRGVQEWYNLSPPDAEKHLLKIPELRGVPVDKSGNPTLTSKQLDYEDWRDRGAKDKRHRAFLFEVVPNRDHNTHPHVGRIKLVAGSLYDTAYKYNFTYCPFAVELVGGFESVDKIADNNKILQDAWKFIVSKYGKGPDRQPMGWLNPGTTTLEVRKEMERYEFTPFRLSRAKPMDSRVKDPSISKTEIGDTYLMARVRDVYNDIQVL